jgi:transcriptional regulator with XRE-family HTH domain
VNIGTRIRTLRLEHGLLGKDLAKAAGVSPSLISQIENNITTPSIDVLRRIAAAVNAPIGGFLDEQEAPTIHAANSASPRSARIVRANARKKLLLPTSKWAYELLTPDLRGRLELLWIEIGPGLPIPHEPSMHVGEEVNVVVKGRVHIWVEDEEFVLDEGDSLSLDSSLPHRTANLDREPAVVISAITPPSF